MIIDIRYHIASLVAVFLALGLGILIGASLLDEGQLVERQEKMITGLERRFDGLQAERYFLEEEIAGLNGKLREQELLLEALEGPLVEGVLAGRTVTLVYGNEVWIKEGRNVLDKLLAQAGAQVVGNRLLADLLPHSSMFSEPQAADKGGESKVAIEAPDWLPFGQRSLAGVNQGLLGEKKPTRPSPLGIVDVMLLVGSGGDAMAPWEVQLVKEAAAAGVMVGVIGGSGMETFLGELGQSGALVIDHIDSVAGRVGLIRGLSSGSSGYYGVGKGAAGLVPELTKLAPKGQQPLKDNVTKDKAR
ncbi:MAG: copper transporter [Firmicutes bacterium]|nr:copper transporter [Bacillota bacterium]